MLFTHRRNRLLRVGNTLGSLASRSISRSKKARDCDNQDLQILFRGLRAEALWLRLFCLRKAKTLEDGRVRNLLGCLRSNLRADPTSEDRRCDAEIPIEGRCNRTTGQELRPDQQARKNGKRRRSRAGQVRSEAGWMALQAVSIAAGQAKVFKVRFEGKGG